MKVTLLTLCGCTKEVEIEDYASQVTRYYQVFGPMGVRTFERNYDIEFKYSMPVFVEVSTDANRTF